MIGVFDEEALLAWRSEMFSKYSDIITSLLTLVIVVSPV